MAQLHRPRSAWGKTSSRMQLVFPGKRIHAIIDRTRAIAGDTDLRFVQVLWLIGYFLRLQNAYDTLEAKRRIAAQLTKIRPYKRAKAA